MWVGHLTSPCEIMHCSCPLGSIRRRLRNVSDAFLIAALTLILTCGAPAQEPLARRLTLLGTKAGDELTVDAIRLCWCPVGKFMMGSPIDEPERRPDEDQVLVTLTQGFWIAKFETTQSQWRRVIGDLPGPLTEQLPKGDEFPVGNVNFAEAETFCRSLTEACRARANSQPIGNFVCLPRRSGSTPAVRAQQQLRHLATNSAANRRTLKASPIMAPNQDLRSAGPQRSAGTRPIRGGFTTCMATSSSGAGIGIIHNCLAVSTRICISQQPPRGCAGVDAGPMTAGPVAPPFASVSNPSVVTITLAFESFL